MFRSLVLVGVLFSLLLLISCGSLTPTPEVRIMFIHPLGWVAVTPFDFVMIGQIDFTSDNAVEGVIRKMSFEAYWNGVLVPDSVGNYPKPVIDGIYHIVPATPSFSTIFNIPLPVQDELTWMFNLPDSLHPVAVNLKLIFEGEDAFGEDKTFTIDFASWGITVQ
jgi:hypothetical protein